jgi:predicted nucleic acid-binding Zn ribbon protein
MKNLFTQNKGLNKERARKERIMQVKMYLILILVYVTSTMIVLAMRP